MPQLKPDIAIDVSFYNSVGGIGTYTWQLLQHLPDYIQKRQCLFLENQLPQTMSLYQDDPYSDKRNLTDFKINYQNVTSQYKIRPYWSLFVLPKILKKYQSKLYHALDGVSIPAYKTNTKYIVTIHDLIPILYPQFSRYRDALACKILMPNAMKKSDVVICDSNYIADQVANYLPQCAQKIRVIPLGVDHQFFQPAVNKSKVHHQISKTVGIPKQPYILSVVTQSPRRNLIRLLQSFELFLYKTNNEDIQLVIAGGKGWKNQAFVDYLQKHPFRERIHITGSVSNQTLLMLYQAASIFAFPSLQEGFGLPVLEAMACGVPVVCSASSSLSEVGGDAAVLVDPYEADSIADAFIQLTLNTNMYQQQIEKGIERTKQFNWKTTAEKTAEVYESLV